MSNPLRLSGIAGLFFVVLSLAASGMNVASPPYDRDGAGLSAWFVANGPRYRIGHFAAGLAFLLFYFPFFAGLCERLREAEGTPALGSRVAWAGALLSPAAGTTAGAALMAAAFLGVRLSPDAAAFAMAANFYALTVSCALGGVTLLGAAWTIIRTLVFRRWLGWTGLGIGLASVAGIGAVIDGDPQGVFTVVRDVAWLGQFLWMAAIAVALLRSLDPISDYRLPNAPAFPSGQPGTPRPSS